jgi:hypothetical protein
MDTGIHHKARVITLTTDFGLRDPFVGIMKGVILGIAPDVQIVDITHDVPPGDIRRAGFCLYTAVRYFPAGTIHVVVVDPGVGGPRRAVAVQSAHAFYVAPDNGVLTMALKLDPPVRAVNLENPKLWLPDVSHTFHGRDIFAPVAAHLARRENLDEMGSGIHDLVKVPLPEPAAKEDGSIEGLVIHIDHFGNCITNLPASLVSGREDATLRVRGGRIEGLVKSYSDVPSGRLLAVVGSTGFVEIAVRDGNAAERLGIQAGTEVFMI